MFLPACTVSTVMNTATNMYVRHTLPLEQARSAMMDNQTKAAVVVDDNFKVRGTHNHILLCTGVGGFQSKRVSSGTDAH
jgi:hypothetical protein